jgi:ATP-dependent RNA helicase DDX18/HAS1
MSKTISSSVGLGSSTTSLLLLDEEGGGGSVVNNMEINNNRIVVCNQAASSSIVTTDPPSSSIQLRNSDPPSLCSSTLRLSTGTLRRTKKGGSIDDDHHESSSIGGGSDQLAVWNNEEVHSNKSSGKSSSSSSSSSGDDSANDNDNDTEDEDLNSAVRRALDIGIAKHDGSEGSISSNDDNYDEDDNDVEDDSIEDDDDEDKLTRITEGEDEEEEGGDSQSSQRVLVKTDVPGGGGAGNRFLAAAVDNYNAMVPIDSAIYEAYDHTFVICPECLRFRFLYTFLRKNLNKKIMIFFSTTNSVRYHAGLLDMFHIPVLTMHGSQRREKFVNRFFKFSDMDEGILCSTDAAGRDLDIPPSVDWVIQFEPPDDPSEFILRVARISCDSDRVGRSLLFLNPGEKQGFLKYYQSASIPVSEFELPANLADVQNSIANAANKSETFLRRARDAYGSYLIAYASHGFRDVYNVHDLNKGDVAIAFGLVDGLSPIKDDDSAADFTVETGTVVTEETGYGRIEPRRGEENKTSKKGSKWKKEKTMKKTWMKGEKSWPHSQIRLHPNFKGETVHH